jgi:hypothetical protein
MTPLVWSSERGAGLWVQARQCREVEVTVRTVDQRRQQLSEDQEPVPHCTGIADLKRVILTWATNTFLGSEQSAKSKKGMFPAILST